MTKHRYKSDAARRMHEKKPAKPPARPSKKFEGDSNVHSGGSRGQSGQPRR